MKPLSRLKYSSLCILIFLTVANSKKICLRQFFKLTNDDFFERLELPGAEKCAEACIQRLTKCRSAMFMKFNKTGGGICNLYSVNSENSNVSGMLEETVNSINTVFEILDECPPSLKNRSEEIMNKIDRNLYRRLIDFNDTEHLGNIQERNEDLSVENRDFTPQLKVLNRTNIVSGTNSTTVQNEHGGDDTRNNSSTISEDFDSIDLPPFPNEEVFEKDQDERIPVKQLKIIGHQKHGDNNDFLTNTNIIYPASKRRLMATDEVTYTRVNQAAMVPIRPAQVFYGGSPYSCTGHNCYAPAIPRSQETAHYGRRYEPHPCEAPSFGNPCYARFSIPCVAHFIPCSQSPVLPAPSMPSAPRTEGRVFDGMWSEWSSVTECSVTCGIGVVQRRRVCSVEGHCSGEAFREEACEREPCGKSEEFDSWTTWGEWSECSQSCGDGKQERMRVCETGRGCHGPSKDVRECNLIDCGQWTEWEEWSQCSADCGSGKQKRFRQCVGGVNCIGKSVEHRDCDSGLCAEWSEWEPWSECSKSCGAGQKTRRRSCKGRNCDGSATEQISCNEHECPVWSMWSAWSACSSSCGDSAFRTRTRDCLYKESQRDFCDGSAEDRMACELQPCPEWSEWHEWSACTTSCGRGRQVRLRSCVPPNSICSGIDRETKTCNAGACPYWDVWAEWSQCSVTCGPGTSIRTRTCIKDDVPSLPNIDDLISHTSTDIKIKNAAKAVLIESSKNRIKNGSNVINHGLFRAMRLKDFPLENFIVHRQNNTIKKSKRDVQAESGCFGSDFERRSCYNEPCCELSPWSEWTHCSVSCGGGKKSRRRACRVQGGFVPRNVQTSAISQAAQTKTLSFARTGRAYFQPSYSQETFSKHSFPPAKGSIFAGLQPIVPVKQFTRPKRQSYYVWNPPSSSDEVVDQPCHCEGKTFEEVDCNSQPCFKPADHCGWSNWGEWCGCSDGCDTGIRVRNRYCDEESALQQMSGPRPFYPNIDCRCFGESIQSAPCIPTECHHVTPLGYGIRPVNVAITSGKTKTVTADCAWSGWNDWGSCTHGKRSRSRSCVAVAAVQQVRCNCEGLAVETQLCDHNEAYSTDQVVESLPTREREILRNNHDTDYCNWGPWGRWTDCTVTCGTGERIRKRKCSCKSCGGGITTEIHACELEECEDEKKRKNPFE